MLVGIYCSYYFDMNTYGSSSARTTTTHRIIWKITVVVVGITDPSGADIQGMRAGCRSVKMMTGELNIKASSKHNRKPSSLFGKMSMGRLLSVVAETTSPTKDLI